MVIVAALAGYAFAWLEFPGRDWIFIGVIALLVVPLQMALIPMFRLYDTFGIGGTTLSVILFHAAFGLPFAIFLLRNFFIGIPKDILESARIDGASEIWIFLRLILPLGLPAIASLAIFQFLWTWNDLIVSLTFQRPADHRLDLRPDAPVLLERRHHRPGLVHLARGPARHLLLLPALLRPGPAGRFGEIVARVAVVGSGLAGFTAYQTLRRALAPGEIAVFGTDADPAAAWRVRAAAIRQREMRSESDGHTCATSFPGLAFSSARRRRSARPLLDSVLDRYHPTVDEFLSHVERLRERSGWDESLVPRRIERVRAVDGGFDLDGDQFPHVLLAPGHPGLNVPEELRGDPRVVHAYEPHDYAATVTVIGAGLAAATEWLNALAAGAEVVLGAPARAGAAPAQRPAPVLLPPRPRRLPPPGAA